MNDATRHHRTTYHVGNLGSLLLHAAREILLESGLAHLSLRGVSARVGVSANAAYRHYANRSELLACLAADGFEELNDAIRQEIRQASSSCKPKQAALAYYEFARMNPSLYQLMFGLDAAAEKAHPLLQAAAARPRMTLEAAIAEALNRDVREPDISHAAFAAWSLVHGLASISIQGMLVHAQAEHQEYLRDRVIDGINNLIAGSAGSHRAL